MSRILTTTMGWLRSRGRWAAGLVFCLLCLGGGAFALWQWRPKAAADLDLETPYLPDDCIALFSVRPREIARSSLCREWLKRRFELSPPNVASDLPPDAVTRWTNAIGKNRLAVSILTLAQPQESDEVHGVEWQVERVNRFRLYTHVQLERCIPDKRLILDAREMLHPILERDGKPILSSRMQRALARVDFSCDAVGVADFPAGHYSVGAWPFASGLDQMVGEGIEAAYYEIKFAPELPIKLTYLCSSAEVALATSRRLSTAWSQHDSDARFKSYLKERNVTSVGSDVVICYRLFTDEFLQTPIPRFSEIPRIPDALLQRNKRRAGIRDEGPPP